jgi:CYTH domain-containing protein/8-oxo-dGTP pyrophosphatase MutT (NUDIX family)
MSDSDEQDEVRAAGGLVVRDGQVLLVHRPRYDDWSLPKGKLDPGESWEQAARREVHEEAGVRVRLDRELTPAHYIDNRGRRKTVRYWVMSLEEEPGEFVPNDEVDRLCWATPDDARLTLTYEHDLALIDEWVGSEKPGGGAEIERKFLVGHVPAEVRGAPFKPIVQGYLSSGGDPELRIRRSGNDHFLTLKAGSGLQRTEEELPIDRARFERLWPMTKGRRIEKVRHKVDHGGRTIEVDVFDGPNRGLVVAEIEFPSVEEARAWTGPAWLGEEVTDDPAYRNATLAR